MAKRISQYWTSPVGRMVFGNLIEPAKNQASHRIEWNVGLEVELTELQGLYELVEKVKQDAAGQIRGWPTNPDKIRDPIKPAKKYDENGVLVEHEGFALLNGKRQKYIPNSDGSTKTNTPPAIYDSKGRIVPVGSLSDIPRGSLLRVSFILYPYGTGGNYGISMGLNAVQIKELAELQTPFDELDEGWTQEEEKSEEEGEFIAF